jgi:hypothetical protein
MEGGKRKIKIKGREVIIVVSAEVGRKAGRPKYDESIIR